MLERRTSPRVPSNDAGLIVLDDREPVSCRIADRSASGVWLWVSRSADVPESFRVTLPETGEALQVDVVRRSATEIAARIAFEIAPPAGFEMARAA